MTDFTAYWHPVLAVPCPDCGKRAGAMCIRPSGHRASDFHKSRKEAADTVFIAIHGETASIERDGETWAINPNGRALQPKIYQTPGTRLTWRNLSEWIEAAHTLDRRRYSSARNSAMKAHVAVLPVAVIEVETDIGRLDEALELLKHGPIGLRRPQRGLRATAPQTEAIQNLMNRRAALAHQVMPEGANWQAVFGSGS